MARTCIVVPCYNEETRLDVAAFDHVSVLVKGAVMAPDIPKVDPNRTSWKSRKDRVYKTRLMLPEYRELLEKVYQMTTGNEVKYVGEKDLGKELGQEAEETKKIVNWLLGEGLLNRRSIGNVELTHVGIRQIEKGETLGK